MRTRLLATVVALGVAGTMFLPGFATATTRYDTTVTIRTQNGDFWGYVKSTHPARCAKGRHVILFKQVGSVQDPSVDQKVGSDDASLSGDRYRWETGNTGFAHGKFYARAPQTQYCKADSSATVTASKT